MEEYMLPCLNKSLLGVECFGCGAQRSVAFLLNGEFTTAFFMYPAIYPILFLLAFLIFNIFVKFKNDFNIKIGLIIFNGIIITISYFIKMNIFLQLTT